MFEGLVAVLGFQGFVSGLDFKQFIYVWMKFANLVLKNVGEQKT